MSMPVAESSQGYGYAHHCDWRSAGRPLQKASGVRSLLLHPEKEPSGAGSEKSARHFSFQMPVARALCAVPDGAGAETVGAETVGVETGGAEADRAVRAVVGLAPTVEARTALQPLAARTAITMQMIVPIVSLALPAWPSRALTARRGPSRWPSAAIVTSSRLYRPA